MTTETEVEWEDVTFEDLRIGDEIEYINRGVNREFKYWGKVIDKGIDSFHMEGDWQILKSTWNQIKDGKGYIRRKVVEFKLPEKVGSVVKFPRTNSETTYVRVQQGTSNGEFWVETGTGERYASWEIELLHSNDRVVVVSEGV